MWALKNNRNSAVSNNSSNPKCPKCPFPKSLDPRPNTTPNVAVVVAVAAEAEAKAADADAAVKRAEASRVDANLRNGKSPCRKVTGIFVFRRMLAAA